jgi:hypothetical protein
MLVHVSDVTPGSMQFVWTPHSTWDDLLAVNVLAIPCLEWYFRHTSRYDPTLTKLVEAAGGHGKDALAKANSVLYQRRYLVRFEFGISIPAGERGRTNQRFSRICASRVPITDEQLADLIRQHTPGKYTLIPWGESKRGEPVEQRRVRVTSCEVYADTTLKITACVCPDHLDREACEAGGCETPHGEPLLSPHAGRGGKRDKAKSVKPKPPKWQPKSAVRQASEEQPDEASPEVGIPTSGATSENVASPHVPPEVELPNFGQPTSKEKKEPEEQNPEQARGAASGADPAALRLAGPETSAAAPVGGPLEPGFSTRPPDARADPKRWHGMGGMLGDTSPAAEHARNAIVTGKRGPSWERSKAARRSRDPATRAAVRYELAQRPAGLPRAAGLPVADERRST